MFLLNVINESKNTMNSEQKLLNNIQKYERELYIWEKNHLEDCINNNKNFFKNKDILELGGVTPKSIADRYGAKSWTSVTLSVNDNINTTNYNVLNGNIETYNFLDNHYDVCITTNCLEHVMSLEKGLLNVYKALKPGAFFSILYGPIWSSHIGHHLFVKDIETNNYYTFNDNIIPPWGHLLYDEIELKDYLLKQQYSERVVNLIIKQVYKSDISNKLFYDDYIQIFDDVIKFAKYDVIEFRNWHKPVYPDKSLQSKLEEKYNKKDFSVISSKWMLQKEH